MCLMWEVEYTDEFSTWWESLSPDEQSSLEASVRLLERFGPQLARPHADSIKGSRHSNMKELCTQHHGRIAQNFLRL